MLSSYIFRKDGGRKKQTMEDGATKGLPGMPSNPCDLIFFFQFAFLY